MDAYGFIKPNGSDKVVCVHKNGTVCGESSSLLMLPVAMEKRKKLNGSFSRVHFRYGLCNPDAHDDRNQPHTFSGGGQKDHLLFMAPEF